MAYLTKTIPLWEKWNKEALMAKHQEIGDREFSRGWKQQALSSDEVLFRPEFIEQCLDPAMSLFFPGDIREEVAPKSYEIYMGVDLAIAKASSKGDYFVICVIAVDRQRYHRRIVGLYKGRGLTFNEQLLKVALWADFFNPDLIFVESNAYQAAFTQELARKTDLPVKAFTTTAVKKTDLDIGLPRMSVEVENSRWTFPMAPGPTRELTLQLVQELKTYPIGRNDDMLMAMWFARCAAAFVDIKIEKRVRVI